jgi:hypothetical protein
MAFRGSADLFGASFGYNANLSFANFGGNVDLRAISSIEPNELKKLAARDALNPLLKKLGTRDALRDPGVGPDDLSYIYFEGAGFQGVANFSGRILSERIDFTRARFHQPPIFDGCKGTSRIDLYGAAIRFSGRRFGISGWTTDSDVVLRLRALRSLADETKNHDLERDLYIEERKAERGIVLAQYWAEGRGRRLRKVLKEPKLIAHCSWMAVISGYGLLSDYGRSFVRPMIALLLSVFAFYSAYIGVLETPNAAAANANDFKNAVRAYAIANAVPFVGSLALEKEVKMTLLCGGRADLAVPGGTSVCTPVPPPSLSFQLITIGQSIFSAICVFFAGLALRNYFKLK